MSERPKTSTRDATDLADRFVEWLAPRVSADERPVVVDLRAPGGAGLSSETLLIDVQWSSGGVSRSEAMVVRLPPPADAFPLFPHYDLERQATAMRFVGERNAVPVPTVHWIETDPTSLGAPFYVMERVDGLVVPDMPPYTFGGWLADADGPDRARVRSGMVDVLVGIHGATGDLDPWELDAPGATALERHVANQRRYYDWVRGERTFPVIDDAFAWLEERWPSNPDDRVLSWGDARLANVLWRDASPVAVLDWEAVAVGPRELDLAWTIFFHEYFQAVAERYGHDGLPDLLIRDQVARLYAGRSGHEPVDLDWYVVYAQLRYSLTSIRVSSRAVHFGERPMPEDPQDLIIDRTRLEEVLHP